MEYRTIEGVELCSAGMGWMTANGPITLTFAHLADAMEAGNNDPFIKGARIKVGHTDPRFNDGEGDHNPFYDGEPTLGKIENYRLSNQGATLVGDFVDVPVWLADAMASAYPNRSIEGAYLDGGWDVTTPGGKHYSFVLTACALLGIALPAVQDLDDLERLLTEGPEEGTMEITAGATARAQVAAAAPPASLAADAERVIDVFYAEFATEDTGRYWWWVRAIWTDPNELIVDDDEGGLHRIGFSSDATGNVSFDEPVPVRQTFVDLASGDPVAAAAVDGDAGSERRLVAAFAGRDADGLPHRPRAAAAADREDSPVTDAAATVDVDRTALLERLGLDAEATDEQISEALAAQPDPPAEVPDPNAEAEVETPAAETPVAEEPVAASTSEDGLTVTVSREQFERVSREAAAGAAARDEQVRSEREATLSAAVDDGRIAPSEVEAWRTKLTETPDAAKATLASLQKGLVPVDKETGSTAPDADQMAVIRASYGLQG